VHNAMEEFVDCTVIEIGKLIFEYMQSRSTRLVQGFNPTRGKGPILLRTTNELKRRLSRETDAAFIGRIMIFISLLLPPWERSGVNLRGNYNVESITKYEDEDENKMAVDGEEDTQGKKNPYRCLTELMNVIEDSFYVKFWSLQKYLKNPLILHNQQVLDEFKPKLDYVLNKFAVIEQERMRLRHSGNNKSPSTATSSEQKMDVVIGSEDKSEYYPGFLKSRQLFDLQVQSLSSKDPASSLLRVYSRFIYGLDGRLEIPTDSVISSYGCNETSPISHHGSKTSPRYPHHNPQQSSPLPLHPHPRRRHLGRPKG
jgi:THO complex subunit 1